MLADKLMKQTWRFPRWMPFDDKSFYCTQIECRIMPWWMIDRFTRAVRRLLHVFHEPCPMPIEISGYCLFLVSPLIMRLVLLPPYMFHAFLIASYITGPLSCNLKRASIYYLYYLKARFIIACPQARLNLLVITTMIESHILWLLKYWKLQCVPLTDGAIWKPYSHGSCWCLQFIFSDAETQKYYLIWEHCNFKLMMQIHFSAAMTKPDVK